MGERKRMLHTKIVLQKSPSAVWPRCWQHQNFFLNFFECPWKIPSASWMGAQALNTHAFENTKQKSPQHLYTYPCIWLCTVLAATHEWQLPWVTEANLTLHSLQTDYVVIFELFLTLSLLTVHSVFTHLILLAIPCSECSFNILPYISKIPQTSSWEGYHCLISINTLIGRSYKDHNAMI